MLRKLFSSRASAEWERVGFIGLGNMGSRMADNLLKAGYKLTVLDLNKEAMRLLSNKGASTAESPHEVAEETDAVITMLPSSSHVLNVYTGSNGLLHNKNLLGPKLFIDSSTIDPQTTRRISQAVSDCSLRETGVNWEKPMMLDAPVSGGVPAAEAGSLTFMVGGPEDANLAARPILLSMGRNIIHCGRSGNGTAAKLCNNLAMAVTMLGVSEALALGQVLGIPANILTKVFNTSSARCWSSDSYNPVPGLMEGVPSSRNYRDGFSTKLMAKDLDLAYTSAKDAGLQCPLTSKANKIYSELCDGGHEMEDFSCAFRHYYQGRDEHD